MVQSSLAREYPSLQELIPASQPSENVVVVECQRESFRGKALGRHPHTGSFLM
jgi:hypothetical protein